MLGAGCGPKPIALPAGDGVAYANFQEPFAAATAACRDVRALTAELGLSGRVGRTKLRGRAIVGVARPDSIRLEALAPFGPPVFILAAHGGKATLLLPRDDRVLQDAAPDAIVEALAGVRIDPASLGSALAGCAIDRPAPTSARILGDRWIAIDAGEGRTVFLERVATIWRVRGARTSAFTVTYDEVGPVQPTRITIRAAGSTSAEVRLRVSQVEIDPALGPEAFAVDIPKSAEPITLQELRQAGPLGERH